MKKIVKKEKRCCNKHSDLCGVAGVNNRTYYCCDKCPMNKYNKIEKKKEIKCPSCGKLLTSVYEYALDWWAGKCVKCKLNTVVYLPIVEEEQFAVYTKNDKGNLVINKKHPLYKKLTGEAKKIANNENL